jgi:hypothetical protein
MQQTFQYMRDVFSTTYITRNIEIQQAKNKPALLPCLLPFISLLWWPHIPKVQFIVGQNYQIIEQKFPMEFSTQWHVIYCWMPTIFGIVTDVKILLP